jgi:phage terminase Nu1 subunit (DNA packaging protein)
LAASLEDKFRQVDVSEFLGVSEKTVSEWASEGLFDGCATFADALRAVYRRLSAAAAGRVGELSEERARLARAQAENVEMKNAVMRREYAPVALLEEALARAARQMARTLEALPVKLRRSSAVMSTDDIGLVEREIAGLRNLAAAAVLEDDGAIDTEEEGGANTLTA